MENGTEGMTAQSAFCMDPSERRERKDRVCPRFRVAAAGEKMPTVYFPKIKVCVYIYKISINIYIHAHICVCIYMELMADLILILSCLVMRCTDRKSCLTLQVPKPQHSLDFRL